jgi:acyl-CoA synthetase (AMP-forming)/AMP-acid ligase II
LKLLNTIEMIGIIPINSVDFVKSVFQVYNSDDVLVILKQSNHGLSLKEESIPRSGGGWLNLKQDVILDNRPAQIVFTSGTEGIPKAILLSHQALSDAVNRLNNIMKVDETISEYLGIPVTYSFGLGRCRAVAAAGGRCFIPENGFNPAELARMLSADEINAISAVPTLWRTLLIQPEIVGAL